MKILIIYKNGDMEISSTTSAVEIKKSTGEFKYMKNKFPCTIALSGVSNIYLDGEIYYAASSEKNVVEMRKEKSIAAKVVDMKEYIEKIMPDGGYVSGGAFLEKAMSKNNILFKGIIMEMRFLSVFGKTKEPANESEYSALKDKLIKYFDMHSDGKLRDLEALKGGV